MRKERALQVILWLVLTAVAAYTPFSSSIFADKCIQITE